jgi:hypothetical protein
MARGTPQKAWKTSTLVEARLSKRCHRGAGLESRRLISYNSRRGRGTHLIETGRDHLKKANVVFLALFFFTKVPLKLYISLTIYYNRLYFYLMGTEKIVIERELFCRG